MSTPLSRALLLAATLALPLLNAPPAQAQLTNLLPFGQTNRIAKVLPSVVSITMIAIENDENGAPRRSEHFGSGFIVDPSGIIATNRHVVAGMSEFTVTLSNGTQLKAQVLAVAGNIDIALLKIAPDKPLPAVKWGDSDKVRVGDHVFAIGNPLGVGQSVSTGIVSGLNRNIRISPYDDFIQTDAAINHGNSGGALVDSKGEVVGVNTAIFSPGDTGSIGIGFAIPANDAQFVIDQLRRFGRVRLGWFGVRSQDVNADMADSLGLGKPRGVVVAGVEPDSPAAMAKLEIGDVILSAAGQPAKDTRALARAVSRSKIGTPIPVVIYRNGKETTIQVTPAEWIDASQQGDVKGPAVQRAVGTDPSVLGLQLAGISEEDREKYKIGPSQPGVLIAKVAPATHAADHALTTGDVIVRVQQTEVTKPEDVEPVLVEARKANRKHAMFLIRRRAEQLWISLPIAPAD